MPKPFLACIAEAAARGEIDAAVADEARQTYEDAHGALDGALSPDEADRHAARAVMSALEAAAVREKQLKALTMRARRSVLEGVAALKKQRGYSGVAALGGKGAQPPKGGWVQGGEPPRKGPGKEGAVAARALELLVENRPGQAGAPFPSIAGRYRAVRGQFDAMMAGLIEAFETKTGFDAPQRAHLDNVVREAFGEDTGDAAAKALAQAWTETAERARQMFNAAGGGIGKRPGWGLPQFHDPVAVRRLGREGWIDYIVPLLNRQAMTDKLTGQPFTEKRLRAVLGRTWERIATGGLVDRQPGEHPGRGRLADQRGEERFLVFRDATAWLAYARELGAGDPFGIMMGHLDEMARDIAQMQVLGPNPQAQFRWLASFAEREAAIELAAGVKGAERARTYIRQAENMLAHHTGAANTPERAWLAEAGATARSYASGVMLGSAVLSDVPTAPVFGAMARAFTGQKISGDMGQLVALFARPESRAIARRMGFINEQATDGLIRGAQESLRLSTVGTRLDARGLNAFARRMPVATFRLSGLSAVTAARKRSFQLQLLGAIGDRFGRTLADLAAGDGEDRAIAALLAARGFTEADWAKISAAEKWSPDEGVEILRPREVIAAAGEELGLRLAEMVELETRFAVPETSLWTRAKLVGQTRPGTFQGEFSRSWAMFRSFSLTAFQLYGEEIAVRAARSGSPMLAVTAWTAGLLALLTLGGGLSIQLKQLVQGKDPRDMTDARFWGASLMQGGGLGIVGDFLYAAQSRAGKSSALTGWGPTAAMASDTFDLTVGNAVELATGMARGKDLGEAAEDTHAGRDAARYVGRYTPFSTLWWARTAWNRGVVDNLQRLLDPEADEDFERQVKRLEKEYGQGMWWPEGSNLPARAPDLAGAVE